MAKKSWWARLKAQWKEVALQYGAIAIVTMLALKLTTLAALIIAIESGMDPQALAERFGVGGAVGDAGKWGVAIVINEVFKPFRIPVAIGLTPFVAKVWYRVSGRTPPLADPAEDAAEPAEADAPAE